MSNDATSFEDWLDVLFHPDSDAISIDEGRKLATELARKCDEQELRETLRGIDEYFVSTEKPDFDFQGVVYLSTTKADGTLGQVSVKFDTVEESLEYATFMYQLTESHLYKEDS